jgi:hypothetical protein
MAAPQKKILIIGRTQAQRTIVQRGDGQQINMFGGGVCVVDGEVVNMDELMKGKQKDRDRPVLGYSIRVTARADNKLLQDFQVPLGSDGKQELKGADGATMRLAASGTPQEPRFSMLVREKGGNSINNMTRRGQCIHQFQLEDGTKVRIVAAPVYEEVEEAPATKKSKPDATAEPASTPVVKQEKPLKP